MLNIPPNSVSVHYLPFAWILRFHGIGNTEQFSLILLFEKKEEKKKKGWQAMKHGRLCEFLKVLKPVVRHDILYCQSLE